MAFESTSAGRAQPFPKFEEIEKLFSWNPPALVPGLGSKKLSTASRPPAYYDKHFSERLLLKRVVHLSSLVPDLLANVDKTLDTVKDRLPPVNHFCISAKQREVERKHYSLVASNEKAVTNFYDKYTARYCSSLASMLALHPAASEWSDILLWTQLVSSSEYAIMDGELRVQSDDGIDKETKLDREAIRAAMKPRW